MDQPQGKERKMQVTVSTKNQTVQVNLNNHSTLNPTSARAARDIAFGIGAHVRVTDGSTTYRVTRSRARKVHS
jgi:hypothetical protein